jgi:hypothetical protein
VSEKRSTGGAAKLRYTFGDGLRGYRFAAELRRHADRMDLRVWHEQAGVVLEFPQKWASKPELASILAEYSDGAAAKAETPSKTD